MSVQGSEKDQPHPLVVDYPIILTPGERGREENEGKAAEYRHGQRSTTMWFPVSVSARQATVKSGHGKRTILYRVELKKWR